MNTELKMMSGILITIALVIPAVIILPSVLPFHSEYSGEQLSCSQIQWNIDHYSYLAKIHYEVMYKENCN